MSDLADPILAIARELGLGVGAMRHDEALAQIHQEILRIKNSGSDVQAESTDKALTKGDSLGEAVAHGHSQNAELRAEVTRARSIINRLASVMQVGQWDRDGTELLERAQQYENWKHDLKRRIRELCDGPALGVDEVAVNGHIADELQAHLARLMAPKELAGWLKSRPPRDVVRAATGTVVYLPYPFTFKTDDVALLHVEHRATGIRSAMAIGNMGNGGSRYLEMSGVFGEIRESQVASEEFVRFMNAVILPILARQRAALRPPNDAA